MLDPQTTDFFHFSGPKHTTPNCPVDLAPNFNPSSGAQSYRRSDKECSRSSYYNIPFFLDRPRTYEEWSVNAHEARPGHHTQVKQIFFGIILAIRNRPHIGHTNPFYVRETAVNCCVPIKEEDADYFENIRALFMKLGKHLNLR